MDAAQICGLRVGMRRAMLAVLMQKALKILRILAVAWIAVAVTVSGVSGMVLCVGADGHWSFEPEHEGRCHGQAGVKGQQDHVSLLAGTNSSADCCGDCVDITLSSEYMQQLVKETRRDRLEEIVSPSLTGNGIAVLVLDRRNDYPSSTLPDPFSVSSPLLAQRTVILLI